MLIEIRPSGRGIMLLSLASPSKVFNGASMYRRRQILEIFIQSIILSSNSTKYMSLRTNIFEFKLIVKSGFNDAHESPESRVKLQDSDASKW